MKKKIGYLILFFVIFTGIKSSVSSFIAQLIAREAFATSNSSSDTSSDSIPLDDIEENADQDGDIDFIHIPYSVSSLSTKVDKIFSTYLFSINEIHLGLNSPPPKY